MQHLYPLSTPVLSSVRQPLAERFRRLTSACFALALVAAPAWAQTSDPLLPNGSFPGSTFPQDAPLEHPLTVGKSRAGFLRPASAPAQRPAAKPQAGTPGAAAAKTTTGLVSEVWAARYNGPDNSDDNAQYQALDAAGNVYVTGYSFNGYSYDPNYGYRYSYSYTTVKYDGVTGQKIWAARYNGDVNNTTGYNYNFPSAVSVDAAGNVFVTGYSYNGRAGGYDCATVKYAGATGQQLWVTRYNSPANSDDVAQFQAVDAAGNVYVTGYSYNGYGGYDYLTLKYNGATGQQLWDSRYNGPAGGYDIPRGMKLDAAGNVFITGQSSGSYGYDIATLKLAAATGQTAWAARYVSAQNNYATDAAGLALDASGNVVVAGREQGSSATDDYLTLKYDGSTGQRLWRASYNGLANTTDYLMGLAVDAAGNVLVTGNTTTTYGYGIATIKYNSGGQQLWRNVFNHYNGNYGYSYSTARAVTVDALGNAYVVGQTYNSSGNDDFLTLKLAGADGQPVWNILYNGPARTYDYASTISVDAANDVVVTGYSSNGANYDFATIKYRQHDAPPVLTVPAAITAPAAAGQCGAAVAFAATATGTTPVITYSVAGTPVTSPHVFPVGTTTVLATASNSTGSVSAAFTVTVTDTQPPTLTAPAALALSTDAGQCSATQVALGTPTAADNCSGVTVTNNAPAAFPKGTTTVTWTATDAAGNAATATQLVTVTDTQRPTISAPADVLAGTDAGQCSATQVALGTPTAADNCSGVVVTNNAPATFPKGTTTITWTATDAAGNVATAFQQVTVRDTEKPVLTVPAALTVSAPAAQCGAVVSFAPTATDNCAGASVVTSPASGSVFPVGTTTVSVLATDASGNVSTGSFVVTVNDVTPPTVLTRNLTVTLINGTATISAAQIDNGSTDACGLASLSVSPRTFSCATPGANPVTLTATDVHGNVTSAPATVTVIGTVPTPAIAVAPLGNAYSGNAANRLYLGYGAQSTKLTATGGVSYRWSPATGLSDASSATPIFTPTSAGTFTYTVTVTNAYGCTATKSVTISVVDVRCGNKNDKVVVCHNGHEICISPNAVDAHLTNHGDYLGSCSGSTTKPAATGSLNELTAFPNPATDQATVSFRASLAGQAQVLVYNELGQRVAKLYEGPVRGGELNSYTLDSRTLPAGLYQCQVVLDGKTQVLRLVVAH